MVMSLFGEFETSLLGTSNDDNPHVFVMFQTYGEPFLVTFRPTEKQNSKKTRDSGMCLKIATCQQRQTKQVTRIQIAGIMRKKVLIFPGQKVFIVSLPKNTTRKKHPLPPPPFWWWSFSCFSLVPKEDSSSSKECFLLYPCDGVGSSTGRGKAENLVAADGFLVPTRKTDNKKTCFSDKKSLGGPEEKGTCRSWTSIHFLKFPFLFCCFFLSLFSEM